MGRVIAEGTRDTFIQIVQVWVKVVHLEMTQAQVLHVHTTQIPYLLVDTTWYYLAVYCL